MIDIKLPIGLMFSLLGVILTIFGLVTASDTAMYETSLNINVNLYSGIVMLVFGGLMLGLSFIKKKSKLSETEEE